LGVARARSADTLAPGQRLGPFLLLAPLGSGGSSRVWAVARAGQLGFTKRMALKVMRQDKLSSERARQRFDREARLGAELNHTNLRVVHDLGSHDGRPYMALSWVDTSLAELLEQAPGGRLEPSVVCWLGMQACAALGAAHGHLDRQHRPCPIVHGDVSPGNILLTAAGHVLLADLAANAASSSSREGSVSPAGRFFGSLGYASPEALKGVPLDGRSDLFSLGCVLYEALSGSPAFEGDDERSLMFQVLERGPGDLRQRCPELPEGIASVVRRALERRVEERFQTAEEMRLALAACVPQLCAFRLEESTSSVIREVLGERIRQREEAMFLAFQRFAPSQFERTDTLPIAGTVRAPDSRTLRTSLPAHPVEAQGAARSSSSGGVVASAERRPARRHLLAAGLVLVAIALGGYAAYRPRKADPVAAVSRLQPLRPSPGVNPGTGASGSAATSEGASAPGTSGADDAASSDPAPGPASVAERPPAPPREQPAAKRRTKASSSPSPAAPPRASVAPKASPSPPKPFEWQFPDDPYGQPAKPKPPSNAPRER